MDPSAAIGVHRILHFEWLATCAVSTFCCYLLHCNMFEEHSDVSRPAPLLDVLSGYHRFHWSASRFHTDVIAVRCDIKRESGNKVHNTFCCRQILHNGTLSGKKHNLNKKHWYTQSLTLHSIHIQRPNNWHLRCKYYLHCIRCKNRYHIGQAAVCSHLLRQCSTEKNCVNLVEAGWLGRWSSRFHCIHSDQFSNRASLQQSPFVAYTNVQDCFPSMTVVHTHSSSGAKCSFTFS